MLPIRHPRGISSFNTHAVEGDGRRPDCRMMRSGKAEDAMCAAGMVGIAGRQFGLVLGIVQTKFESRRVIANICTRVEAANCDKQALRGDRICDDDAGQRSQEPRGFGAQSEYAAHDNGTIVRPQPHCISLRQSKLYTTLSAQNDRPPERLTHGVARKRHSQRHRHETPRPPKGNQLLDQLDRAIALALVSSTACPVRVIRCIADHCRRAFLSAVHPIATTLSRESRMTRRANRRH